MRATSKYPNSFPSLISPNTGSTSRQKKMRILRRQWTSSDSPFSGPWHSRPSNTPGQMLLLLLLLPESSHGTPSCVLLSRLLH